MRYLSVNPKLYVENRKRFMKAMKPNSIAIFAANPVLPENGDAVYNYKPNSDIIWLSGIRQEQTWVILYPDNADTTAKEVLVIQRPNELLEKWNGHLLRPDEATALSGIQKVMRSEERRVGKESRSRWGRYKVRKKKERMKIGTRR